MTTMKNFWTHNLQDKITDLILQLALTQKTRENIEFRLGQCLKNNTNNNNDGDIHNRK